MNEEIDAAAARWLWAQADDASDPMDWDGFTAWLEADDRHRLSYDALALLNDRIDCAAPALRRLPSIDLAPMPKYGWRPTAWSTAVVAAILGVVGIGAMLRQESPTPSSRVYAPAPGRSRAITIAEGSIATLSPGSTLRSGADDTAIAGRAYFDIRHDPANPLIVRAAGYTIRDVGTRFEVTTSAGMLRIAVAEGEVAVTAPGRSGEVRVGAGRSLTAFADTGAMQFGVATLDAILRRAHGAMAYDDMPIGLVAADLSRYAGTPVTVSPDAARRRFSGVISPGKALTMADALARLTGLKVRKMGNEIRLDLAAGG